ncbi:O-antigen polysaccharide polymerase Wzy [Empedobacter falsenii]
MLLTITLTFIIIGFLVVYKEYKKKKDFFHPKVFTLGYFLLYNFYYLYLISSDPYEFSKSVQYKLISDPDEAIFKYIVLQCLFYVFYYLAFLDKQKLKIKSRNNKESLLVLKVMNNIAFFYTLFAFPYFIIKNGGFIELISDFSQRSEYLTGDLIVQILFKLVELLSVLSIYLFYKKIISKNRLIVTIILVLIISLMSGGRGNVLNVLIACIFAMNYSMGRFVKFIDLKKYIVIIVILAPLFIIIPKLRNQNFVEEFMQNPKEVFFKKVDNGKHEWESYADLSRAYIPIFILDNYNIENFWYGKSFIGFFTAIIPRSIYHEKPIIDEGLYIYEAVHGNDIQPPANLKVFKSIRNTPVGWPPRTLGLWYVNFGILGVILSGFIFAKIINIVYINTVSKGSITFFQIFLYFLFLTKLQLNNVGLFTIIQAILVYYLFYKLTAIILNRKQ